MLIDILIMLIVLKNILYINIVRHIQIEKRTPYNFIKSKWAISKIYYFAKFFDKAMIVT